MKREWQFEVTGKSTMKELNEELSLAIGEMCFDLNEGKYLLQVKTTKRSIPQNSLQHKWYPEIAEYHGCSIEKAKSLCKLEFGIPLLCRDDRQFSAMWDKTGENLDYDAKLYLMMMIPVSSLFNRKQAVEYMDTLYRVWLDRGVPLTNPDDRGRDYLEKD